ncbi:putative integrase core domain containing protein [Lyophyllum shimeji]|uniref:Integrase core domain containing protein n=1 Tax=Lyophyllum shimeji TaxID=47721 RepID=A0A9P3UIB9_LYOSH|nr:putative integrase core domain containing protein [Lyophyllum shimeji]
MKLAQEEAKAALAKAKDDMARYYDQRRIRPRSTSRAIVYTSTLRTSRRRVPPRSSRTAILDRTPSNVSSGLLPGPDPWPPRSSPPPPTLIDDEEWFDVEDILDSRFFCRKLQYKVKWKGYGYEDASWLWRTLRMPRDLVREFHRRHPDAPSRCTRPGGLPDPTAHPPASAGLRTSPPASVLIPPDSSFLHRRIPDSRLIVAPRVPHITIQFLQGTVQFYQATRSSYIPCARQARAP